MRAASASDHAYARGPRARRGGDDRRHPAARRGARPLAGVRRHRRVLPQVESTISGCATASPPPSRATPRPPATSARRCRPGSLRSSTAQAQGAAATVRAPWRLLPGGDQRAAGAPGARQGLARRSTSAVERLVRDWQGEVLDLVRDEGKDRRTTARIAAYGLNGIGVVLMLVAFAHTGGLIGRRGRHRRRHRGARPEGARGDLRRPGRARDGGQGARAPARAGAASCMPRSGALRRGARRVWRSTEGPGRAPGRRGGSGEGGSMSPLKMGSRQVKARQRRGAGRRGRSALAGCPGRRRATSSTRRAADGRAPVVAQGQRSAPRSRGDHTVVALAGATGSGKSSLFNALVGADVATVGARRPTTSTPDGGRLGRRGRHRAARLARGRRAPPRGPPRGVATTAPATSRGTSTGWCCSTCPTSTPAGWSTAVEAERVLELVDVFVWVTDPQKYADARLHDDYLAALSTHDAVTVVVLNQADRLTPDGVAPGPRRPRAAGRARTASRACRCSRPPPARARASTTCGTGWPMPSRGRSAARHRLAADVRPVAGRLRAGVADTEPTLARRQSTPSWSTRCPAPPACPSWSTPSSATTGRRRGRAPAGRSPGGSAPCGPTRCSGCA